MSRRGEGAAAPEFWQSAAVPSSSGALHVSVEQAADGADETKTGTAQDQRGSRGGTVQQKPDARSTAGSAASSAAEQEARAEALRAAKQVVAVPALYAPRLSVVPSKPVSALLASLPPRRSPAAGAAGSGAPGPGGNPEQFYVASSGEETAAAASLLMQCLPQEEMLPLTALADEAIVVGPVGEDPAGAELSLLEPGCPAYPLAVLPLNEVFNTVAPYLMDVVDCLLREDRESFTWLNGALPAHMHALGLDVFPATQALLCAQPLGMLQWEWDWLHAQAKSPRGDVLRARPQGVDDATWSAIQADAEKRAQARASVRTRNQLVEAILDFAFPLTSVVALALQRVMRAETASASPEAAACAESLRRIVRDAKYASALRRARDSAPYWNQRIPTLVADLVLYTSLYQGQRFLDALAESRPLTACRTPVACAAIMALPPPAPAWIQRARTCEVFAMKRYADSLAGGAAEPMQGLYGRHVYNATYALVHSGARESAFPRMYELTRQAERIEAEMNLLRNNLVPHDASRVPPDLEAAVAWRNACATRVRESIAALVQTLQAGGGTALPPRAAGAGAQPQGGDFAAAAQATRGGHCGGTGRGDMDEEGADFAPLGAPRRPAQGPHRTTGAAPPPSLSYDTGTVGASFPTMTIEDLERQRKCEAVGKK